MLNKELEVKESKSYKIIAALLLTGLVVFFIYEEGNNLFDWKKFNPNGMNTIFFLIFCLFCLMTWINYFDTRPLYKIDLKGVWKRKNLFSYSLKKNIAWGDIQYFYILQKTNKGVTTEELIFRKKDSEKEFKIGLTGLDSSGETITNLIIEYATLYGIHDLGREIKP